MQAGGTIEPMRRAAARCCPTIEHWSTYGRLSFDAHRQYHRDRRGELRRQRQLVNWSAVYIRQGATAITSQPDNPFLPLVTHSRRWTRPASPRSR